MLDRFFSRVSNICKRIMFLLRGRLVKDEDLIAALNSFNDRLESRWSAELSIRSQEIMNEQQNVLLQLRSHADQLGTHADQLGTHADQLGTHAGQLGTHACQLGTHAGQLWTHAGQHEAHAGQLEAQTFLVDGLSNRFEENSRRTESRLDFLQDLLRQQVLMMPSVTDEFEKVLRHDLLEGLLSEFQNNYDPFLGDTVEEIHEGLNAALVYYRHNFDGRIDQFIARLPMDNLNKLHDSLTDVDSKKLLAKLIAFRLLGLTKVRLRSAEETDLDRDFYVKIQEMISVDTPPYHSGMFEVPCYDLHPMGLKFRCHSIPFAINVEFRNLQYANSQVKVEEGDWVLDCGACWGDTSLWFADQAGPSGRVFAFEFIPSSLDIFHANLAMNPELSKCIELVTHPVAESTGTIIRCKDNGAASTFKIAQAEDSDGSYVESSTVSIDDWLERRNPEKVDFIKMDIEGAELDALRGAMQTLKHFRPRLAIALYHQPEDLYQIPDFLMNLDLGYRFYLKHPTAEGFETVLLAKPD